MAYITFSKKGLSALEMKSPLGHFRWQAVWKLTHKIRTDIGKWDNLYQIYGLVEFNQACFSYPLSNIENEGF